MAKVPEEDLHTQQGDILGALLEFTDDGGKPLDVTDRVFTGQVRARQSSDAPLLATFAFDMTNASVGVVLATLTPAETAALRRDAYYDIQMNIGSGSTPNTLQRGVIHVTRQVTVPA